VGIQKLKKEKNEVSGIEQTMEYGASI